MAKHYPGPIILHDPPKEKECPWPKQTRKVPRVSAAQATLKRPTYTQCFGTEIIRIADANPEVQVITPAMREGSGLVEFEQRFPDRYYDVGIAEEHAVTFAAGLSKGGVTPVLAIYSTFLQRGFDQVIHDVCLQKLSMVFAIDRAGLVGADGPTHHGVFDYSYLLMIPNMVVCAPKDGTELKQLLTWATTSQKIVSIRYPRGEVPAEDGQQVDDIEFQDCQVMVEPKKPHIDTLIIATGTFVWPCVRIGQELNDEHNAWYV